MQRGQPCFRRLICCGMWTGLAISSQMWQVQSFGYLLLRHYGCVHHSWHVWLVFHLMSIEGHRCRYYAQHANGNELCTTSNDIQMSTVFDGRSFRMDRVRIMCTDDGGDLFMDDFQWVEETN